MITLFVVDKYDMRKVTNDDVISPFENLENRILELWNVIYLPFFDHSTILLFEIFARSCVLCFVGHYAWMLYFIDVDHILSVVWSFILHSFTLLQLTNTISEFLYVGKHFDRYFIIIVHCHWLCRIALLKFTHVSI